MRYYRNEETDGDRTTASRRALALGFAVTLLVMARAAEVPPPAAFSARVPQNKQGGSVVLQEENDFFVGRDRHYTQGVRLAWLGADGRLPRWLGHVADAVPAVAFHVSARNYGFEVGQMIYTPDDTGTPDWIPSDRPYAGWLYGGLMLERRGALVRHPKVGVVEDFRVQLGMIGPASLAQAAQDWAHRLIGNHVAQGWDNQLPNEPGFNLKYQRAWLVRLREPADWGADVIPHLGVSLGTVDTSLRAGAIVRFGWHLPNDVNPQIIDSAGITQGGEPEGKHHHRWGAYAFAGAEGRVVGRNAFLDGDLFRTSHRVSKRPLVADLLFGTAVILDRVEASFTVVWRSEEFVGQREPDLFGSLTLKVKI